MLGNAGRKQAINQSDCQNAGRKHDREKGLYLEKSLMMKMVLVSDVIFFQSN